ncbi:MAG: glycine cleavage system protein GcvH [Alphaproteobacteria bacterium]|nr:glycine cleavage system protein GcvH [Alphaproteobacteria bacterium]
MKKYTDQHEWVLFENDVVIVGITDHAQHQLGDVVYVDLPTIGKNLAQGEEAAVVESVKAASEVYSPISGQVVEINSALQNTPGLINSEAESKGWFLKLRPSNLSEMDKLMDESAYKELVGE